VLFAALPASAATASFAKVGEWDAGYQGLVTVTNDASDPITTWQVEFDLPAGSSINQSWSSERTNSTNHYTFTNAAWNGSLAPGASTTFGFIVNGTGTPTNCTVNGASCARGPVTPVTTAPTTPPIIGDPAPPTVPGNLRSTGATATSVSLAWDASTAFGGVTEYLVSRSGTVVARVPGTSTSTTVSGLTPGTAYEFTVTARGAVFASQPSAPLTVTTAAAPTTPPPTTPPPSTPPTGTTPVAINGQLHVCGVHLCNQYNRPIQLRGVSSHGIQWFGQCVNNAALDALAVDWKADVFRIAMYVQESGYETNPAAFTAQVQSYIDMATARGLYVIVDFHTLSPGDPNHNTARAKTFFQAIASRNATKNNIIYEIANEPNGVSWAGIKSYAEQVIPVIRAADPDGVVLVGTRAWSSLGVSEGANETEVINNPVNAANIMYTFHFYASSHQANYRATVSRAAARLPLFVSEFGTQTASGDGANDLGSSGEWIDLLDRLKIGYAVWSWSDYSATNAVLKPGTCAGGNYRGTGVLSQSGTFIRGRISTPDNFPTS